MILFMANGRQLVRGVNEMHLVDTLVCVVCSTREYSRAKGKSARVQNAVCDSCVLENAGVGGSIGGVSSKDGPTSVKEGVSPRKSG